MTDGATADFATGDAGERPFHAPTARVRRRHRWRARTLASGASGGYCPRCGIWKELAPRAAWWTDIDDTRHAESVPLCRERMGR